MRGLLRGRKAQLVASDPPYNLPTAAFQGRGKIKHPDFLEGYGEKTSEEFTQFLTTVFRLACKYSVDGSLHYYWGDWRHAGEYIEAGKSVFDEFRNVIVWDKICAGMGGHYRAQHEFMFLFKSGTAAHINNIELGRRGVRSNVWRQLGGGSFGKGRREELALHPTVKPISLLIEILKDATRRGDVVLDPFAGSGSIFVAAERVRRRAFGMEIDPKFVDVAVRRWQSFSKRSAILCATGQTFDQVSEIRTRSINRVRLRQEP